MQSCHPGVSSSLKELPTPAFVSWKRLAGLGGAESAHRGAAWPRCGQQRLALGGVCSAELHRYQRKEAELNFPGTGPRLKRSFQMSHT